MAFFSSERKEKMLFAHYSLFFTPWHTIYSLYYLKTKGKKKKKTMSIRRREKMKTKFVREDKTSWLLDRCT
jgi:hypothetical protein